MCTLIECCILIVSFQLTRKLNIYNNMGWHNLIGFFQSGKFKFTSGWMYLVPRLINGVNGLFSNLFPPIHLNIS